MKSKQQLEDSSLLVHYDLKKPLRLACDASPYRAGAGISHVMENGTNPLPLPLGLSLQVSGIIHKLKKRRFPSCLE